MPLEADVERHYAQGSLEATILAALEAAGKDIPRLTPADLAPVDEFHVGGRVATAEFAARLGLRPAMRVLDVGCGLGGALRYFAGELGCDGTGVDLTREYVAVAATLARMVGLQERTRYLQASALALPFAEASFDAVTLLHVGSNIADKPALFQEVSRVLAPGGVVGVYDLMREAPGELKFPVPWASDASTSFLNGADAYASALRAAGFQVSAPRSRREFALAFFQRLQAAEAKAGGAPPPLGLHLAMGRSAAAKVANMRDLVQRGLIAPTEIFGR
jgi:ubiquinone/menaquinone biosynthesis C-methylase UbiE